MEEALQELTGAHHRILLQSQLSQLDFSDGQIRRLDEEVSRRMHPFEEALVRLDSIPGAGRVLRSKCLRRPSRT